VAEETAAERMRETGVALDQAGIDELLNTAVTFAEAGIVALTRRTP
jgi:hypothetical protein